MRKLNIFTKSWWIFKKGKILSSGVKLTRPHGRASKICEYLNWRVMSRAFWCFLSSVRKAVNLLSWVLWNVKISEENLAWWNYNWLRLEWIVEQGTGKCSDSWQQHAPFKKHNLMWWFLFHQKATWNPTPFNSPSSPSSNKNVGLLWHWQVQQLGIY